MSRMFTFTVTRATGRPVRVGATGLPDLAMGVVRYRVQGPRLHGVFVLAPVPADAESFYDPSGFTRTQIRFGDGAAGSDPAGWLDRPVVHGSSLLGEIDWDLAAEELRAREDTLGPWPFVRRGDGRHRIPAGAAVYVRGVCTALLADFEQRPDRPELLAAALRCAAPGRVLRIAGALAGVAKRRVVLDAEAGQWEQRRTTWSALAEEAPRSVALGGGERR